MIIFIKRRSTNFKHYNLSVLEAIQDLLVEANPGSPANGAAADLYTRNRSEYEKRIKAQAKEFAF